MPPPLNPPQQEAVRTLKGPMLVLAGAGTGKTRVVTFRIAELIRHGIRPSRILGVTFTNKAAAEMKERVGELLGKKADETPEISTFHSLCVRVLRRHIRQLGYPERFTIYDQGDQESLARQVLREIKVDGALLKPGDLLAIISRWKSAAVRPSEAASVAATDKEHLAAMAYRRYQRSLKTAGAVDFDDLLLLVEDLFRDYPDVRQAEAQRFDHVLIDEYQDTNASQYAIVKALAQGHRNLCVVGDDDQSIYAWRGAEVKHILSFRKDWPDAKVVRLEDNYRSTAEILAVANRLIAFNRDRYQKVLRPARPGGEPPRIEQYESETDEAERTIADIRRQLAADKERQPRDFAILFRTNEQPRAFETELRKHKLPYVLIGGKSFFDRREVKDMLAYIKLLAVPNDEPSLLRIINTPPRGIGQAAVEKLQVEAVRQGVSVTELLPQADRVSGVSPGAARAARILHELLDGYRRRLSPGRFAQGIVALLDEIQYKAELKRLYPEDNEHESRWNSVGEVVNALAEYERRARAKATLVEFLDEVLLGEREFGDDKEKQLERNAIVLMTLHSAKGLEFPIVYMVGLEEGILPHTRSLALGEAAIDEERRLCYVGVTRAQQRLTLSLALTRMKWGKPRPSDVSRFLWEIVGKADNPHARGTGPAG